MGTVPRTTPTTACGSPTPTRPTRTGTGLVTSATNAPTRRRGRRSTARAAPRIRPRCRERASRQARRLRGRLPDEELAPGLDQLTPGGAAEVRAVGFAAPAR